MNMYNRSKKAKRPDEAKVTANQNRKPKLEEFIKARDYTGAVILLEFQKQTKETNPLTLPWLGYAAFHLGDYKKALNVYTEILAGEKPDQINHLYAAASMFFLGLYTEAEEEAKKGPKCALQNRILFHIANKQADESKLMVYHQSITADTEDQLSLASMHYLRSHFQEATDIYKKLLSKYRDYLALQVYVALCYYKLDYYDVSLEILTAYLQTHPDSAIAINLKACNHYKLFDGKAAQAELKVMIDALAASSHAFENDFLRHNTVVFQKGENALQVLPPLVDIIPEARLNLVIYHLHQNEVMEAYELIKDLEPQTPQEYTLKGVVNAAVGQLNESKEHLELAQRFFQLVGQSASECDTIPGRQCMASCFFLLKNFKDVLIYLNSIKAYNYNDSIFSYNFGIAQAAVGQYAGAEEALVKVEDENIRSSYCYLSWLARTYIMNDKAREAWELYLKMESNTDSLAMLVLIANDCYKVGSFFYACKAFDVLDRLDPSHEYWEGKRGACCGVFQQVLARREKKERLREVIMLLQNNANTPQAEYMTRVMSKWAQENGVNLG
mmetsp:Transcript_30181/g.42088  ORF Transcript_30181/g.42088 Transcript_30181/m.42088 type:complete len:556 (+) Transcript_30181:44-1711(+)|eukprot:CAMPEP_0175174798 /NCGR_PEP_ID=MMETSP0087-20121206/32839_1 /TAXON_ID=136419 /ORGANISM="Unknown Unknown, Strain D1" /LENGTH=555 /DNA_ID=CAMNT_0016466321 /DNA_START=1 /DNA_END=1668 /DNA_ORIENTATION=+